MLANILSSKKSIIINKKNRLYNNILKSKLKTFIKKFKKSVIENNKNKAKIIFKIVHSLLDKLTKKNIIHRNKANRSKSRLMKKIK